MLRRRLLWHAPEAEWWEAKKRGYSDQLEAPPSR